MNKEEIKHKFRYPVTSFIKYSGVLYAITTVNVMKLSGGRWRAANIDRVSLMRRVLESSHNPDFERADALNCLP